MKRTDESKGADNRDGGDNWEQQDGYGERVLDPDDGASAAEEEAERAERSDPHGGAR